MQVSVWMWVAFTVAVVGLLFLDLTVFHRDARVTSKREAAVWSAVWVGLALLFNLGIYAFYGKERALEFLAGYLIEKSLSVDNIFVFLMLFSYFSVPDKYRHRVLFWGILGALVMRGVFIGVGAALLHHFHWVMYIFGAFLVFTGLRMLAKHEEHTDPSHNPAIRLLRRFMPITTGYEGQHFLVRHGGQLFATPLLVVLVTVETTDLVFAVDSIPAIFAVTDEPFIVYTSNVFAILGLRALFFLIAGVLELFVYLRYGLGCVLSFVGVKMLLVEMYKIPIGLSLGIIAGILTISVVASLLFPPKQPAAAEPATDGDEQLPATGMK